MLGSEDRERVAVWNIGGIVITNVKMLINMVDGVLLLNYRYEVQRTGCGRMGPQKILVLLNANANAMVPGSARRPTGSHRPGQSVLEDV